MNNKLSIKKATLDPMASVRDEDDALTNLVPIITTSLTTAVLTKLVDKFGGMLTDKMIGALKDAFTDGEYDTIRSKGTGKRLRFDNAIENNNTVNFDESDTINTKSIVPPSVIAAFQRRPETPVRGEIIEMFAKGGEKIRSDKVFRFLAQGGTSNVPKALNQAIALMFILSKGDEDYLQSYKALKAAQSTLKKLYNMYLMQNKKSMSTDPQNRPKPSNFRDEDVNSITRDEDLNNEEEFHDDEEPQTENDMDSLTANIPLKES